MYSLNWAACFAKRYKPAKQKNILPFYLNFIQELLERSPNFTWHLTHSSSCRPSLPKINIVCLGNNLPFYSVADLIVVIFYTASYLKIVRSTACILLISMGIWSTIFHWEELFLLNFEDISQMYNINIHDRWSHWRNFLVKTFLILLHCISWIN